MVGGLTTLVAIMLTGCYDSSTADFPPAGGNQVPTAAATSSPWQAVQLAHTMTKADEPMREIAISSDGQTIASGSVDGNVDLWAFQTGKRLRDFTARSRVASIAFSPDGQTLATGGDDGRARLWQVSTGQFIRRFTKYPFPVQSIAFNPDGTLLATTSWKKTVELWDVKTGNLLRTLTRQVWDVSRAQLNTTLIGHSDVITSIAIAPDGHTIISGSRDKTIKIWNMATGALVKTIASDRILTVAVSPDGRAIVSTGSDGTIKIW